MKHEVVLLRLARLDLAEAYERARSLAPAAADRWLDRLRDRLRTLETDPARFPLAFEHRRVRLEVREMLFGRRPNVFRVVFLVHRKQVLVLRIRRGQRRWLTQGEITEASQPDDHETG
jgi:plasmid stabilization system protein ParE